MTDESASTASGTVYTGDRLERFIPISKAEIFDDLLTHGSLSEPQKDGFRQLVTILGALYHYQFHSDLERLKNAYGPFSPDSDNVVTRKWTEEELLEKRKSFLSGIGKILDDANYEPLTAEDINVALKAASPYGLSLFVDLSDFDEMLLFCRGAAVQVEWRRTWTKLWLGRAKHEIPIYKRLALVLKLKPETDLRAEIKERLGLEEAKAAKVARRRRSGVTRAMREEAIYLKLFRDIPRCDLEMLFPNTQVRMNLFDKVKIGATGSGATGMALFKVFATAFTLNPLAFATALFGLVMTLWYQAAKVFNLRTRYMITLSQNLYFHNLDNNAGVFTHLIDLAEEEECKEAILAYYFLLTEADQRYSPESLDRRIEEYVAERYGVKADFEVADGLAKLRKAGILVEGEGGSLAVLSVEEACRKIDAEWDGFFQFDRSAGDVAARPAQRMPHPPAPAPYRPSPHSVAGDSTITRREELPPEILARLRGQVPQDAQDVLDQVYGLPVDSAPEPMKGASATSETEVIRPIREPVAAQPFRGVGADEATMALPTFSRDLLASVGSDEPLTGPPPAPVRGAGAEDATTALPVFNREMLEERFATRSATEEVAAPEPEAKKERVAHCESCGARFNAERFQSGVKFRCKKCKGIVVVP